MNRKLQRSLSLAMLTLTLAGASTPTLTGLAATDSTPSSTSPLATATHVPSGQSSDSVPTAPAKPTKPEASKPTKPKGPNNDLPDITNEYPVAPQSGPGSRIELSQDKPVTTTDTKGKVKVKEKASNNNTRDLGGYVTADGQWQIKPNRLIRSANLHHLTPDDVQILVNHHVKKIVDMRTPWFPKNQPDVSIPGAEFENISVLGHNAESGFDGHSLYDPSDGGFYDHQLELGHAAMTGYSQFLHQLLTQSGATLFHCSSGKDRTGIATVLVMSALGMDTSTIANDYLLSNTYRKNSDGSQIDSVQYKWLKEYYREINKYYGSMTKYLENGLHFSPAEQELLRSQYLVSTDGKETPYPAPVTSQTPAPAPTPTTPVTPAPEIPAVPSTPAPAPTQPAKQPTASKPVTTPTETKPTPPLAKPKSKAKIKIISIKKVLKGRYVHVKGHRAYFYDVHLKHKVGRTALHSKTKWKIVKKAKLKIHGKTKTYFQIKSPHGYHRWILSSDVTTK